MNLTKLKYTYPALFFLCMIIVFSACKSKQTLGTAGELRDKTHDAVIKDVQSHELKYKNLTGKVSFALVLPGGPKNTKKVGGVVKLIKDEAFQVSFRMLGIEGFRITVTPDTVYVIDRMNKNYSVQSIQSLQKEFNFSYYNLQALITNALFLPGKQSVSVTDYPLFTVGKTSDLYMIKTADTNTQYTFAVDANERILSTLIYKAASNQAIQWSYQNFIVDGKYIYPTEMQAQVDLEDKRFNMNMSFDKINFDTSFEIDYSLPSKYNKVTIKELMKSYIK